MTKQFYIKLFLLILFFSLLSGSLLAQILMPTYGNNNSVTVTGGEMFYDDGGSSRNYSNRANGTITFNSASGTTIKVTFTSFSLQNNNDYLYVYDGSSASSGSLVGAYSSNNPGTITSSGNALTFRFNSNRKNNRFGWVANVEVIADGSCDPNVNCYNFWGYDVFYIQNVKFEEIDNSSTCDGLSNFTHISTDIEVGNTYPINIQANNPFEISTFYRLWIDWNQDGDFNDSGEEINVPDNSNNVSANITIPANAVLGTTVMRIKMMESDNSDPCQSSFFYGEVEDYSLNIIPNQPDVSLDVTSTSINENGGSALITVNLDLIQSVDVVVTLAISGDVSASDYSISSLSITIPAGSTSANVSFSSIDDVLIEGDEDAIVEIVNVIGASEDGVQQETITIVDDEEPSQIQIPFEQRTSQYTPEKKIYNVKGDFTMIGNTNLTLYNYNNNRGNGNNYMIYVDEDSDPSTFNSSSATLDFSTENGAKPQCSNIIYAGLYWTGRANSSWSTSRKRDVLLKYAGESAYQSFSARAEDIYYPSGSESDIYAAYIEVTDYVHDHGIGEYFVANMALSEGNGGGTGYCGGWGLVVVYENSKMKWRDVTLYDGYAYVSHSGSGSSTSYEFPISGFNAVQSGDVNIKLGLMASEGDVDISGDFIEIQNAARDNWTRLSHAGNTANNFFNSSIETGGNNRSLNLKNNTGIDISMFDVPNSGNSNIENGQTSTRFRYGTSQDAYAIFALAMSVDAYVPEAEATNAVMTIDGQPIADGSMVLPGQEIMYQLDIRNRGTEAVNDARLVLPIPYTTEYVSSSAVVSFSPATNNVYYDPTEGATGSIVWEIGDLPVPPEGPDHILGTLTYTVKVTEDCSILGNTNCDPSVAVGGGGSSGTGATSGTTISGFSIIQGYETSGECVGEPIVEPIEIQIDAEDYVAANCTAEEINSEQEYFFCNLGPSASIPITEVSGNFPPGSRFYDDYPVVEGVTEEFTISNEFLADIGTTTYYAVPPGFTNCYYTFKITVKDISSTPTVNDISYCEGDLANVIQGTPSDPAYGLYYYATETGGSPSVNFVPPTNSAGTTTYYVAEGESSTCLSPNRVPVVVTVNALPEIPITDNANQSFCGSVSVEDLEATSIGNDIDWYDAAVGGNLLNATTALSDGATYYAEAKNASVGCTSLGRLAVNVTISPQPTATAGGTQTTCPNMSVTVNGATSGNGTIGWTHNGTGSLFDETTLTPTYTPTNSDLGKTVTLTMTVTGENACDSETATAEYYIVVEDNEAPVLSLLSDLSIEDCSDSEISQVKTFSGIALPVGRYSDNCSTTFTVQYRIQLPDTSFANDYGSAATGASVSDPSGFEFPEGVSTIFFRVLDASGNISNIESFTISVNHKPNPSEIKF